MSRNMTTTSNPRPNIKAPAKTAKGSKLPRGYGAMRDVKLNLDPRIDLTKPIYEQVITLEKVDAAAHR